MEQKIVRVSFDVDTAKKIQKGEIEGRIVRKDGTNVRVVCWDAKSESEEYKLLVLVENGIFEVSELYTSDGRFKSFKENDECDLVIEIPKRLDNALFQFEPFDRVLVRDNDNDRWKASLFSHIEQEKEYPFVCLGVEWKYCIPYNEKTAHLLGTRDNWEE